MFPAALFILIAIPAAACGHLTGKERECESEGVLCLDATRNTSSFTASLDPKHVLLSLTAKRIDWKTHYWTISMPDDLNAHSVRIIFRPEGGGNITGMIFAATTDQRIALLLSDSEHDNGIIDAEIQEKMVSNSVSNATSISFQTNELFEQKTLMEKKKQRVTVIIDQAGPGVLPYRISSGKPVFLFRTKEVEERKPGLQAPGSKQAKSHKSELIIALIVLSVIAVVVFICLVVSSIRYKWNSKPDVKSKPFVSVTTVTMSAVNRA